MAPKCIRGLVCGLTLAASIAACAPQVRKSDDGNLAWARQVVVTLLGRQPAGETEVRVVADLAGIIGRQRAAESLMARPEFAAYWSDLLVDLVRAPREGNKDLTSCVGTPLRSGSATAALAEWVKNNDPSNMGAPGGPFNLADLLASSIAADDLSPFLRGYVFAFASRPLQGNEITELNRRDDLYNVFEGTLLGRNSTCLACHNSAWSVTGRDSGWNRTFAPLGYFERSIFGAHSGAPEPKRVKALFRVDGVGGGASTPWGMSNCGSFQTPATDDPELAAGEEAYLAGPRGRRASILTAEQLLRSGIVDMRGGVDRSVAARDRDACTVCGSCPSGSPAPNLDPAQQMREDAVKALFQGKNCFTCHGASAGGLRMRNDATWKDQLVRVASVRGAPSARVAPSHATDSFLIRALDASAGLGGLFPMPPGSPLTSTELDTVRAWINGMPVTSGCTTCASNSPGLACPAPHANVPGDEALAYLIAMNLTDNIWSQVMGRPMTIAHGYSRNMAQNFLLWHLTEFQFIANGWSLKKLLGFIVASDYYNRRPPEDGDGIVKPSGGSSPYDLPMFFDPWIEQDPRVAPANQPGYVAADHPEKHANAMSESVERKAPVTLLRSVASALGWPMPQRVPQTTFPNRDLAVSIGQFMRDSVPGFRGENLTAFIEWEANVATCRKPAGVATDWIDRLTTAIQNHNTANPGDRVTVAQAAEIVKDWILADGRMSTGERAIVARLFGRGESDPTTLVASLNDRLRDFCGVLLETPQFKLAGVTADGVGSRPKLRVCNGSPCSYRELCAALLPQADLRAICQDQSIRSLQPEISSRPIDDRLAVLWPPRPPRWDADSTHVALASETIRKLSTQPSDFRLSINPKQLRQARVQRANGVAILEPGGLKVLTPGSTIPADAIVVSEKGAELQLTLNRATIPVQLSGQQLAEGSIQELDRQLAKVPKAVRERAIKAARAGIPLAEMARPQHAISPVPADTVDTALSSAFPFGSAGDPIGSAKPVPFDDKPLQERFEKVRRLQR